MPQSKTIFSPRLRQEIVFAISLTLLAVLIRLPHLGWGLPEVEEEAFPMKKAFAMWGWSEGRLQLDPQTAGWPSLSFYVHLLLQHLHYWVGRLLGTFENRYDYYLLQLDMTPVVLLARMLGVAVAGSVVWVGTRLGYRLAGAVGAGLVGASLALNPMLVAHAQLITPDILLTFCAALAIGRIVAINLTGRNKDYIWAGIWIGLGISCKYTPILLLPAVYLAHLMRLHSEGISLRLLGLNDGRLWWAALACLLAFALTSPYVLADLDTFRRDFTYQSLHLQQGHIGQEGRPLGYIYYLKDVLGPALGWPGLLLALAGLGCACWRERGVWLVVALCALPFLLILGGLSTQFDRYLLPMLLPLTLGLAGLWTCLRPVVSTRGPLLQTCVVGILTLLVLAPPTWGTWRYHQTKGKPSTLLLAKQFIQEELGITKLFLAMEAYCPNLPRDRRDEYRSDSIFTQLSQQQQQRLLARPFYYIVYLPFAITQVELIAFYYELRHLIPYEYIVTSSSVRRRYERNPSRFPHQIQYYHDLEEYTQLVQSFRPGNSSRGPEIRIYRFATAEKARLLREKGDLLPGFYEDFADGLHQPQFHGFCVLVAQHAAMQGHHDLADLYYQAIYETSSAMQQQEVLPHLALAKLETGQLEQARQLFERLLTWQPNNFGAEGYLALTMERMGDLTGARQHYERCIDLGLRQNPQSHTVLWARRQLENLTGQDGEGTDEHRY